MGAIKGNGRVSLLWVFLYIDIQDERDRGCPNQDLQDFWIIGISRIVIEVWTIFVATLPVRWERSPFRQVERRERRRLFRRYSS